MVPRTDTKEKEPSPLTAQTQSSKKYTWDQSQYDFTQNAKETFEIGKINLFLFYTNVYHVIKMFEQIFNFQIVKRKWCPYEVKLVQEQLLLLN